MSDTPRTDDRVVFIDGNPWVNAPFARGLETELNAANERIRQLQAVVNDPEVLWTNWLRGTVKLPSSIGDVRQYQAHIKRLEEAGDALKAAGYFGGWADAVNKWNKAKEAKP